MDPAKGIAWDTLPRNFRNAIEVARALGIDYIWIDSLCIVQGEGGDFEAEGQLMHRVYRNSYCNLAAVDSSGCQGGFFPDGLTAPAPGYLARTVASSSSSPVFGGRSWHILPSDLWESRLLRKVLYRRGWVFQGKVDISSDITGSVSRETDVRRTDAVPSIIAFRRPPDICESTCRCRSCRRKSCPPRSNQSAEPLTCNLKVGLFHLQRMRSPPRRPPRSPRHHRRHRATLEGAAANHANKHQHQSRGPCFPRLGR